MQVFEHLNLPAVLMTDEFLASAARPQHLLKPGHGLNKPEVLVAKISPEQETELREKFSGTQASRSPAATGMQNALAHVAHAWSSYATGPPGCSSSLMSCSTEPR